MKHLLFLSTILPLLLAAACNSSVGGGSGGEAAGSGGATAGSTTTASTSTGNTGAGGSFTTTSTGTGTGGGMPCPTPSSPQAFELGTGETCFARLTPMETVPVMAGPQGGFHIWMAVGCADCDAQSIIAYGVKDPMTNDWFAGTFQLKEAVDLGPPGWRQRAGYKAFLPGIAWDPTTVLPKGSHVLLTATILDGATMMPIHSGEVEVILGDEVPWSPPCDPTPNCGAPGGLPCCSDGIDGGMMNGGGSDGG